MSKRKACKRCGAFTTRDFCRNEDCMEEHIEELEAKVYRLTSRGFEDLHDRNEQLQRKYEALVDELNKVLREMADFGAEARQCGQYDASDTSAIFASKLRAILQSSHSVKNDEI